MAHEVAARRSKILAHKVAGTGTVRFDDLDKECYIPDQQLLGLLESNVQLLVLDSSLPFQESL